MAGWVLWVLATGVFAIGELLTARFVSGSFAVGGAAAALAALSGAGGLLSWIVFIAVTTFSLTLVRPTARARIDRSRVRAGTETLVGKEAVVLERIANREGVGCVRIDGEVWTARAFEEERVIDRGTHVEVVQMKGATALVVE